MGSLFIVDSLYKIFGKDNKNKDESKFDKMKDLLGKGGIFGISKGLTSLFKTIPILGTALRGANLLGKSAGKNLFAKGGGLGKFFKSGATKTAFKAMGPMMIVTSIIEMAIDAIKGIFKSKTSSYAVFIVLGFSSTHILEGSAFIILIKRNSSWRIEI
jgi:hypothetical protein